jgi:excisionase family DNA binding protein
MSRSKESLPELHNDINYKILCRELDKQSPERREKLMEALENPEQLFLSVEQFAQKCGVPVSRVRKWIKEGSIAAAQRGRCYLIPVAELEAIMKEAYESKK